MNPDLEKLIQLQEADRELARLAQEIAALPRRVAAIEAKLADARARAEAARGALKSGELNRRKLESDIQGLQQKISKYKEQMLEVKTNEQYKALVHEVEYAEKEIRSCEDRILESMVDAEAKEKELRAAEAELKAETAEIDKEKAEARARTEEDEKLQAEWQAKRKALREDSSGEVLRHYDRVLKLRGSALAEAIDHKCAACQVMLRPQVNNDVRTNEQIVVCDSCHRILYFIAEHQTRPEEKHDKQSSAHGYTVEKAWYYVANEGPNGAFIAFVNHRGSCSMRKFDALSGQLIKKKVEKSPTFKEAFPSLIEAGIPVYVEQPNLEEECGEALPSDVLEELRHQVGGKSLAGSSVE